jgi:hypothetical protein
MCILSQATDPCGHFECFLALAGFASQGTDKLARRVTAVIDSQNALLLEVLQHSQEMHMLMDSLEADTQALRIHKQDAPAPLDLSHMTSCTSWTCELVLVSELPNPIFKEKGFPLTLRMSSSVLAEKCVFTLGLYSQEDPPKPVTKNIVGETYSGKKVLRGTLQAKPDSTGLVVFPNVVVNEVSSHYVNDGFFLVVADPLRSEIRPLILKEVTVRARKSIRHT